jgi:hypothetical protein
MNYNCQYTYALFQTNKLSEIFTVDFQLTISTVIVPFDSLMIARVQLTVTDELLVLMDMRGCFNALLSSTTGR